MYINLFINYTINHANSMLDLVEPQIDTLNKTFDNMLYYTVYSTEEELKGQ